MRKTGEMLAVSEIINIFANKILYYYRKQNVSLYCLKSVDINFVLSVINIDIHNIIIKKHYEKEIYLHRLWLYPRRNRGT